MVKILGREGSDKRKVDKFYVVVVQAVLLFGLETWVVTTNMEKSLTGLQHWAVRWISGMVPEI